MLHLIRWPMHVGDSDIVKEKRTFQADRRIEAMPSRCVQKAQTTIPPSPPRASPGDEVSGQRRQRESP